MGTRATYRFLETENTPETTVYIHFDGYPEWAVDNYILNACNGDYRKLSAEQFIRANERAEIVSGHDHFGGTEYRYDFTNSFPNFKPHPCCCVHILRSQWDSDEWIEEWNGTLQELQLASESGEWTGQTFERANAN